ncbi:MAG: hypothetical protein ACRDJ4_01115 [Actinomycetota bacterium]
MTLSALLSDGVPESAAGIESRLRRLPLLLHHPVPHCSTTPASTSA